MRTLRAEDDIHKTLECYIEASLPNCFQLVCLPYFATQAERDALRPGTLDLADAESERCSAQRRGARRGRARKSRLEKITHTVCCLMIASVRPPAAAGTAMATYISAAVPDPRSGQKNFRLQRRRHRLRLTRPPTDIGCSSRVKATNKPAPRLRWQSAWIPLHHERRSAAAAAAVRARPHATGPFPQRFSRICRRPDSYSLSADRSPGERPDSPTPRLATAQAPSIIPAARPERPRLARLGSCEKA